MTGWRAALAGGLAFAASFALQAVLLEAMLRAGVAQPLAWIAVLLAPPMEEWAKWWTRARFRASWAGTGLAFGTFEALLKPLTLLGWTLVAGMAVAPLQHAAYGRWAARRGLRFAILLHVAFNAGVLAASLWLGAAMWWLVLPAAAAMLVLSWWPAQGSPCQAPLDAGKPPP